MVQKTKTTPDPSPRKSSRSPARRRPLKSPAQEQSVSEVKNPRGRPRSPARTVSPARSPSRRNTSRTRKLETTEETTAKSPVVVLPKVQTPLGKSSSRSATSVTKKTESYVLEKVGRPDRRTVLDADTDSDSVDITPQKPRSRSYRVAEEKLSDNDENSEENNFTSSFHVNRRVTSLSSSSSSRNQNREIERIVHVSTFDGPALQKLSEFSDEDEFSQKYLRESKSKSIDSRSDFQQITEFGGSLGVVFFTLLIPFGGIALFLTCNETHCSFTKLPPYRKFLQIGTYFNLTALLGVVAYVVLIAILTALPFGGKKITGLATKQGKFTYVLNSPFALFFVLAIAGGLEYKGIPLAKFITEHTFELFVASYLCGLLLSIWVYVRSFYEPPCLLNTHCFGKSWIYGFFMGRNLNPRLFGVVDLKTYVVRECLIGSILINLAYVYRNLKWVVYTDNEVHLNYNPTLLVLVAIESIYLLDGIILENTWVTSFEIQYEGFGYMSAAGYLVYPFMASSLPKYIVDYNIQLENWKLILTSLLFLIGLVFFRGSNNQKDAFRRNPYDPAFANMETIPTTKGKKLLCSGFWGIVRHPNYLGDILINISFVPFVFSVPPVLNAYAIVLLLVHRSFRDHARCKQKYGAAWDRYCKKVKYVLVPKIY